MLAVSLLYHDVVEDNQFEASGRPGAAAARYKLDVDEFANHLEAIASKGAKPSNVGDLLNGVKPSTAPFFITFDDGGNSAVQIGEMLQKRSWCGHFFVTGGNISDSTHVNPDQIRALESMGHVIGSHSWSHPERMASCSWKQLLDEWGSSVSRLSEITGHPVTVASVPGGYFSREVAEAAAESGLRALFTSEPVRRTYYVNSCLVLGRYMVVRGTSCNLAAALAAPNGSVQQLQQYFYWNLKKIAKTVGGTHYLKLRRLCLRLLARE